MVHSTTLYPIIVQRLLLYTHVFLSVQFSALCFSPCILRFCPPLLSHTIIHYSFADDLQLQMSVPLDKMSELLYVVMLSDVKALATANMLKLNDDMTELMIVTSK